MIAVADLRDYLKADEADDGVLEALELAAVQAIQHQTGRYFGPEGEVTETRVWRAWPLVLANAPLGGEVTTVEIRTGSTWEAVAAGSYYLEGGYLWSDGWLPGPVYSNPVVRITYLAGYEVDAEDPSVWAAPEDIKQAVRMLVGHWMENREAVLVGSTATDLPLAVEMLLGAHKRAAF